VIDYVQLEERLDFWKKSFQTTEPFPHVVVDDFCNSDELREVVARFPRMEDMQVRFKSTHEHKAALADLSGCDPLVRQAFDELNGPRFVGWLEQVTGIGHLLTDPENLGGGIHQSGEGMYLDVHVDFNRHTTTKWYRRLNVLLYLNEGWTADNGGVLELWPADMSRPEVSVVPGFNRMVVFSTTGASYHGYDTIHPPPGGARRSFAAYYYTAEAPAGYEGDLTSTAFRLRPHQSRRFVPLGVVRALPAKARRAAQIIRHGGR
jgi:hypothetical protein